MTILKDPGPATVELAEVESAPPRERFSILPDTLVRMLLSSGGCLALALALFVVGGMLAGAWPLLVIAWFAAALLLGASIVIGVVRALVGTFEVLTDMAEGRAPDVATDVLAILKNLFMAGLGMLAAYYATMGFSRGRQLRRRGRVLLPALREGGEWATRVSPVAAEGVPAGLADQWRENGKTEHASVAAFARLTLDLMALSAPPRLVADANQDALDEIRHAELCFSLAAALDGKRLSPAPFPVAQRVSPLTRVRSLALAQLAVSSLVDGALHEGVSARIIARLAKRCEEPAIRDVLKSIAADEGRHAAHGWTVVEWCAAEGGTAVRQALLGALRGLPSTMRTALPEGAADGGWERWGIHGHALEAEEYGKALALVTNRVQALTITATSQAA